MYACGNISYQKICIREIICAMEMRPESVTAETSWTHAPTAIKSAIHNFVGTGAWTGRDLNIIVEPFVTRQIVLIKKEFGCDCIWSLRLFLRFICLLLGAL